MVIDDGKCQGDGVHFVAVPEAEYDRLVLSDKLLSTMLNNGLNKWPKYIDCLIESGLAVVDSDSELSEIGTTK